MRMVAEVVEVPRPRTSSSRFVVGPLLEQAFVHFEKVLRIGVLVSLAVRQVVRLDVGHRLEALTAAVVAGIIGDAAPGANVRLPVEMDALHVTVVGESPGKDQTTVFAGDGRADALLPGTHLGSTAG